MLRGNLVMGFNYITRSVLRVLQMEMEEEGRKNGKRTARSADLENREPQIQLVTSSCRGGGELAMSKAERRGQII
ncbi:hypothetical protein SLEP1_g43766 [Rubroshorea leprosula]|uniref:Uncharacterized protein n=1 Tax=Rubroshorea leprosula TaxID=152421 RepID=A0AAV5LEK4_9ROSI|nr:hypothetical protein SLEP1_g43766 [Rubroshorea leprosula]